MQPQTPLGLLDSAFDPLRQTRRGTRLALGEACTADAHCMTHVCRCPQTYRRRPEMCPETGKVCTELLPVGAECDDSRRARPPPGARSRWHATTRRPDSAALPRRKCISHKCYCAKDPWNREQCTEGPRKCCFWSWGYWECEGAFFVEDAAEQQAQHSHDMPQGFVPQPEETPATA